MRAPSRRVSIFMRLGTWDCFLHATSPTLLEHPCPGFFKQRGMQQSRTGLRTKFSVVKLPLADVDLETAKEDTGERR